MANKREFTVEVYRMEIGRFRVEADSVQGAVEAYKAGEGEFIEYADFVKDLTEKGADGIRCVTDDDANSDTMWEQLKAMQETNKTTKTRQEVIDELSDHDGENLNSEDVAYMARHGCVGYNAKTNEQLIEDYLSMIGEEIRIEG